MKLDLLQVNYDNVEQRTSAEHEEMDVLEDLEMQSDGRNRSDCYV